MLFPDQAMPKTMPPGPSHQRPSQVYFRSVGKTGHGLPNDCSTDWGGKKLPELLFFKEQPMLLSKLIDFELTCLAFFFPGKVSDRNGGEENSREIRERSQGKEPGNLVRTLH